MSEITTHPLWRKVAAELIEAGLEYGQEWPVSFFEHQLRCQRDSTEFKFSMINLRSEIETNGGVYIESLENGAKFRVLNAPEHEDKAGSFDRRMRSYARRGITLRAATLSNPKALLTDSERSVMERNLEHASIRWALISRAVTIGEVVKKHAPKLLQKATT